MKYGLIITVAATLAMLAIAFPAFADTVTQTGAGNIAQQNVGNTTTTGSYNPNTTTTSVAVSSADADSYNTNVASQHQGQGQHQSQTNKGNNLEVEQNYAASKRNVATAFAAPLVAADDTCMGSSSAGGQGSGFGLSFGSTWKDGDCVRRKDARELHNMGVRGAALALMCQNESVAEAMETAGTPCIGKGAAGLSPAAGVTRERVQSNPSTEGVIIRYPTSSRVIDRL